MKNTLRNMGVALVVSLALSAGTASAATTVLSFTDNTAGGGGFEATFGTNSVAAHDYDLVVMGGLAPSFSSGSYTGNLSISSVPETETYAMLLVGLGLIGFAARRRKNNFN